ncbi:hypothetical protein [Halorussus halobius]|uniref:hypothetical protein n=1 Tax=Halorussus halobius TaxID=1710537 RepID=UPI001092336B|nr:hypothetical protein [Halorussus halobius]
MTDATDYDPVDCPASDCTYSGAVRSVAGHVSATNDDAHSWDRLGYDGAREFVMAEKRRQRGDAGTPRAGSGSASAGDAGGSDDAPSDARSGTGAPADDDSDFELGFERDALVLLHLASEYDLSSLDDLGTYQLADLYSLLADVKNAAEDARQEVRDALLEQVREERTVAADLGSVERRTYTYRQLEDEATVRHALADAGVDPQSVRSFDESKIRDAVEATDLDEDAVFDVEERAQMRIADSNDGSRRRQFDRLDPDVRELADDEE